MISKELKNKVIAGVVFASILGGAGTVFADTNAGGQLQSWYNKQFSTSSDQVWKDLSTYGNGKIGELTSWFNGTKNTSVTNVTDTGTNEIARANREIGAELDLHINDINNKVNQIKSSAPGQYDTTVSRYNNTINGYADSAQAYANGDIKKALDNQGTSSFNKVNEDVTTTKDNAINALTQKIVDAKKELSDLIKAEETAATNEVKAHLDDQISEKKLQIKTDTDTLEAAKKKAITDEGAKIEGEAKTALDALAEGIFDETAK